VKILCNGCGRSGSTDIPNDTIIRAWVECPECIDKKRSKVERLFNMIQKFHEIWNKKD
jgi:hypothetical protein